MQSFSLNIMFDFVNDSLERLGHFEIKYSINKRRKPGNSQTKTYAGVKMDLNDQADHW